MLLGISTAPNPYTATLTTIAAVPADITAARTRLGVSITDQAAQIGITVDTLTKLGPTSARSTVEKCLTYLANLSGGVQ